MAGIKPVALPAAGVAAPVAQPVLAAEAPQQSVAPDFSKMSIADIRNYADTVDEQHVIDWCVANKREKPLLPEHGGLATETRAAAINKIRFLQSLEVVELKLSPNQHTPGKFYPVYCVGPNGRDEQWLIELKKWTKVPRYVVNVIENAVLMEPETDDQGDGAITVVTGYSESARFSYQVRVPQDDNEV